MNLYTHTIPAETTVTPAGTSSGRNKGANMVPNATSAPNNDPNKIFGSDIFLTNGLVSNHIDLSNSLFSFSSLLSSEDIDSLLIIGCEYDFLCSRMLLCRFTLEL